MGQITGVTEAVIKESDIFGGTQWTKGQQYGEEIQSLLAQIHNTIESYNTKFNDDKHIKGFMFNKRYF